MNSPHSTDPTPRPIEKGDRFEDLDSRNAGRVIEVDGPMSDPPERYWVRVEVHPLNPSAVGRHYGISGEALHDPHRYRRISR